MVFDDRVVLAELDDTRMGRAVGDMLPFEEHGSTWGEEVYFSLPGNAPEPEDWVDVVEPGDLAYWPPGNAFCIFWGPTPMSRGNECRPASEVEVIGRITGDISELKGLASGNVRVEAAD
jgi:hypothetical protein